MMLSEAPPVGSTIQGTYELVRCIGAGGMGTVYEAKHARLSGRYAVKFLLREIAQNEGAFARFRREAEVTSAFRHPNIVQVIDFDRMPNGTPYLVMEMLEGREVSDVLRAEAPLAPARAVDLIQQIASALDAAHQLNIVHRDLKPQNLFLVKVPGRPDLVKVMDFGISKVREATTQLTRENAVMGTPQYMAPEQALGQIDEIDGRTDQFALSAIAYEMLVGRAPFRGDTIQSILYQVVHAQPAALDVVRPSLGPKIAAVVAKGLSKAREDRYPSVLEMADALASAVSGAARAEWSPSSATTARAPNGSPPPQTPSGTLRFDDEPAAPREEAAESFRPRQARARTLAIALAIAAVAAVTAVIVSRVTRHSFDESAGAPPPPPVAPVPAEPGIGQTVRPAVAELPVHAPTAKPAPQELRRPVAAPVFVHIDVRGSTPPGLQTTIDGVVRDLPIEIARGPALHELRFDAPGYETFSLRVDGTQDRKLVLPMKKVGASKRVPPKTDQPAGAAAPIVQHPATLPERADATPAHQAGRRAQVPPPSAAGHPSGTSGAIVTDF